MKIFNKIRNQFWQHTGQENILQYLQDRILFAIFTTIIFVGLLALIPSLYLAVATEAWSIFVFDLGAYSLILSVFFLKNISNRSKAYFLMIITMTLGIFLVFILGPGGTGFQYVFTFAVISALMLPEKQAYLFLVFAVIAFAVLFTLPDYSGDYIIYPDNLNMSLRVILAANYIFLDVLLIVSVMTLVNGLHQYAKREKQISRQLETEQQKQEETIARLHKEIAERKKTKKALNESEYIQRALFEQAGDGIIYHEFDGTVIDVNKKFCNMVNYTRDELIGINIYDLDQSDKQLAGERINYIKEIGSLIYETKTKTKNDDILDIEIHLQTITLDSGQYVLGIVRDLSERKKNEEKINKLNQELEQRVIDRTAQLEETLIKLKEENFERKQTEEKLKKAEKEISNALELEKELHKLKSHFISMVSHEYRTPLTVILSSSYLLEKYAGELKDEKFDKHINRIRNSVDTMTSLMENVLILGKTGYQAPEVNLQDINIFDICAEVIDNIKKIDNNGHNIYIESISDYIYFNTDEKLFNRIVYNILMNSVKYSLKSPLVKLEILESSSDIKLQFYDSGIGIPKEELPSIFDPFFRGDNINNISGTGLGLSVVKKFVETLKGQIFVNSELNVGTTVTVILPRMRA